MKHQSLPVNGIRLHIVEEGEGPLVLLVHGFPESWYSWRHQLPVLAAAGYRAVALDVRGYGRSSAPAAVDAYRMLRLVADNVQLVHALGADHAVIVGHDWGAPIAWTSALLRPDVFRAVAGLSVPYAANGDTRPTDAFRAMAGDEESGEEFRRKAAVEPADTTTRLRAGSTQAAPRNSSSEFYIEYFQEPGRAEAELERDVRRWLLGFYFTASGDAPPPAPGATVATIPHGAEMQDRFAYPETMPAWMTDEDLDVYAGEFEHTGFTGGLNRYRNVDRDWEDLSAFRGRPIDVPALFVGGSKDGPTVWGKPAIDRFAQTLPKLHRSIVLDGCGHWTQQERPTEVNEALLDFLASI